MSIKSASQGSLKTRRNIVVKKAINPRKERGVDSSKKHHDPNSNDTTIKPTNEFSKESEKLQVIKKDLNFKSLKKKFGELGDTQRYLQHKQKDTFESKNPANNFPKETKSVEKSPRKETLMQNIPKVDKKNPSEDKESIETHSKIGPINFENIEIPIKMTKTPKVLYGSKLLTISKTQKVEENKNNFLPEGTEEIKSLIEETQATDHTQINSKVLNEVRSLQARLDKLEKGRTEESSSLAEIKALADKLEQNETLKEKDSQSATKIHLLTTRMDKVEMLTSIGSHHSNQTNFLETRMEKLEALSTKDSQKINEIISMKSRFDTIEQRLASSFDYGERFDVLTKRMLMLEEQLNKIQEIGAYSKSHADIKPGVKLEFNAVDQTIKDCSDTNRSNFSESINNAFSKSFNNNGENQVDKINKRERPKPDDIGKEISSTKTPKLTTGDEDNASDIKVENVLEDLLADFDEMQKNDSIGLSSAEMEEKLNSVFEANLNSSTSLNHLEETSKLEDSNENEESAGVHGKSAIERKGKVFRSDDRRLKANRHLSQHQKPKEEGPNTSSETEKDKASKEKRPSRFICTQCSYPAPTGQRLKLHTKAKHEPGRERQCSKCDYRSKRKDHFTNHLQDKHGIMPIVKTPSSSSGQETKAEKEESTAMEPTIGDDCIENVSGKLEEMLAEFNDIEKSSGEEDGNDQDIQSEFNAVATSTDSIDHEEEYRIDNNQIQDENISTDTEGREERNNTDDESTSAPYNNENGLPVSNDGLLSCTQCDYKPIGKTHAGSKQTLKQHVKAVHEKIKDKQCSLCDFTTAQKSNLNTHMKKKHNKE